MKNNEWIEIKELSSYYQLEISFFNKIDELGIVKFATKQNQKMLHFEDITIVEKAIRLHHDLNVNPEGIDVIFNLLNKIDVLQQDLLISRGKLDIYNHQEE